MFAILKKGVIFKMVYSTAFIAHRICGAQTHWVPLLFSTFSQEEESLPNYELIYVNCIAAHRRNKRNREKIIVLHGSLSDKRNCLT